MTAGADVLARLAVLRRVYPPSDTFVVAVLCRSDPAVADRCVSVLERWITESVELATKKALIEPQREKAAGE